MRMKKVGCMLLASILALSAMGCAPKGDQQDQPITKPNFTLDLTVPESDSIVLPALLASKPVLQQNAVVKIWGEYDTDGPMAVAVNDQVYYGECKDGHFELLVQTPAASKNNTITIYSKTEKKTVTDVWFGEVFLCSGQSNMEVTMYDMKDPLLEQTDVPTGDLRIANVPRVYQDHPETEPHTQTSAVWQDVSTANLAALSAVAYHFGVEMEKQLDCPVGIVVCCAGGTIIVSWLSEEDAAQLPPIYQADHELWIATPAYMYNTMLHPILNYHFRSVIWYQGENQSYKYDEFLTKLIQNWRKYFDDPDLPFTVIELVGCGDSWIEKWPEIRASQRKVCETLENCTLSVGLDLGEEFDIHPRDKQPVGQRAAYATLNALYGRDMPESPVLQKATRQGAELVLEFSNGSGLKIVGESAGFEVSPDGRAYYPATARVEDGKVILTYQEGLVPTHVRYAWVNFPQPLICLYNGENMPADSFLAAVQ